MILTHSLKKIFGAAVLYSWMFSCLFMSCTNANSSKSEALADSLAKTSINIDSLMAVSYERGVFNGNVLVAQNNNIIYQKEWGFADGSKTKKLPRDAIFNIGSIVKEFNAVAVMMLKEKGKLSLDDPVAKFDLGLPAWAKKVKVSHLLNYTGGLPRVNWRKVRNMDDILNDLKHLKTLKSEPGSKYIYSNNSVFLQMMIVAKVSKMSFAEFVQQQILTPLGMKNTILNVKPDNPKLVQAFNNEGKNDAPFQIDIPGFVYPTASDMIKWVTGLHGGKLISKASLQVLLQPFAENRESSLGHGKFENNEVLLHYHHGSSFNYESYIYNNLKTGLSVVLFTNNKNFKLGDIARAIDAIAQNKPFELPQKSVYLTIRQYCYDDVDKGIAYYKSLKKALPEKYDFTNESGLQRVGYKLIDRKQVKDAIKIFQLWVTEFPNSANAYDSLGEALFLDKQYREAFKNYKKSLELNPENANAKKMIEKISKRSLVIGH